MENPATWKKAETVITDTYDAWKQAHDAGATGASYPRAIADALRAAGLLNDADDEPLGWEGIRDWRQCRSMERGLAGPDPTP